MIPKFLLGDNNEHDGGFIENECTKAIRDNNKAKAKNFKFMTEGWHGETELELN